MRALCAAWPQEWHQCSVESFMVWHQPQERQTVIVGVSCVRGEEGQAWQEQHPT
jgi:hypothetical protein